MNNKDLITWKHLQKYLTCQPYFVWNEFKAKETNDKYDDPELFWSLDFDENNEEEYSFVEVHKTGFDIVQNSFNYWIQKKCIDEKNKLFIIKEKDLTLRIESTKVAMNNPDVDIVLFPVFEYNGAISKPTLFDKKKAKISNLNMNTSTKRVDYIRSFFDFEIVSKNNYKVLDFSIFTIEIKDFKTGDKITFDETFFANTTTTKPNPKSKTIPALRDSALGTEEKLGNTIFEKIASRQLLNLKDNSKKEQIVFSGIDYYLTRIKESKTAKRELINEADNTVWGSNKFFTEIAKEDFSNMLPLSGTLFKKKNLLEFSENIELLNEFYDSHKITKYMKNHVNEVNHDNLETIVESLKNKKVVWYDFEGFSIPFPLISYTLPYQQLIFQVSVIRTEQDKIIETNNLVIDPKHIEYSNFFDIIDAIYIEDASAYVVYNQSYENTKLKEMSQIFYQHMLLNQDSDFTKKVREYDLKINSIIEKTVDLLDLFKVSSLSKELPPIFLWELYGFSSIKKIEKYITKKNLDLEVMIEPYSELVVQNGLMAMSKAVDRYLGGIGDVEWENVSNDLKKYCENDVKAMIMVYHFAKKLLKDK